MRSIIIILFIVASALNLNAQNNCERNLNDARADYASGNLYAIPGKLTDCLEEGFSESEKIAAYQLLALTYININQQEKAKESLIKLLNIKTDYQVIKNVDPDELYSLYTKIETDPIYYIGAYIGLNYTFANLADSLSRRTLNSSRGDDNYTYTPALSLRGGAQFIYPVKKWLYLSGALAFDVQKYEYRQSMSQSFESENITNTSYSASSSGIELRLNARYMQDNYEWKPFVEGGMIHRFHLQTTIQNYVDQNNQRPQPFEEPVWINKRRRNYNIGLNLQIGTMKKFQENYIELSVGANYFLIPEVTVDNYNQTVANAGTVVEDNYSKLVVSLELKFNVPFYNFK